jgi:hypothetical protein
VKRLWKVFAIAAVVVAAGILAVGAVALAQDTDDGAAWPINLRERIHEAAASILGVSPEIYEEAIDTARDQVLDEAVSEGLLTQEQAERMQERREQGAGPRIMGGGYGARGGRHGAWGGRGGLVGGPENSLVAVAAEELGMTTADLLAELQNGESIADVAAEKGVDPQDIADAFTEQRAEALLQAVEDGRITQERADWMLDHMSAEVLEHLSQPLPMVGPGRGGCWGEEPGQFQGQPRMRPGRGLPGFSGGDDA